MSLVSTLADLASALDSGEIYVNIHADAHPDGEIRGQIINTENPHPLLIQLSDNQPSLNKFPFFYLILFLIPSTMI
jgi:CHRD domain